MLSVPILIIHAVLSSVLMILVIVFILLSPDEIEINQRDQLLHKLSHVLHLLSFMLNLFMVPFFSTLQYIIPRYLPLAVLSLPTTLFIAIYNGG